MKQNKKVPLLQSWFGILPQPGLSQGMTVPVRKHGQPRFSNRTIQLLCICGLKFSPGYVYSGLKFSPRKSKPVTPRCQHCPSMDGAHLVQMKMNILHLKQALTTRPAVQPNSDIRVLGRVMIQQHIYQQQFQPGRTCQVFWTPLTTQYVKQQQEPVLKLGQERSIPSDGNKNMDITNIRYSYPLKSSIWISISIFNLI